MKKDIKKRLTEKEITSIEEKIDYIFEKKELLQQAFTRKSFGTEYNIPYNAVLKIIGDSVLKTIVIKEASESFGLIIEDKQKEINIYDNFYETLEEFRKFGYKTVESVIQEVFIEPISSTEILAISIMELALHKIMLVNKSDIEKKIYLNHNVLADLFKSILGSVAVDSKWDWNKIYNTYNAMIDEEQIMFGDLKRGNFVSSFEEWYNLYIGNLVEYNYQQVLDLYKCSVTFDYDGKNYNFEGEAKSKKKARMICCEKAMIKLDRDKLLNKNKKIELALANNYVFGHEINLIQELYQKKLIPEPKYELKTTYDENGNPIWNCKCNLAINIKSTNQKLLFNDFGGVASSKTESKQNMLSNVLIFLKKIIAEKEDFEIIEIDETDKLLKK